MSTNATLKLFKSIDDNSYFGAHDAINAGADTNAIHEGYTPLTRAVLFNRPSFISLLLWNKADPEISCGGRTAIQMAWSPHSTASFCALADHKIGKEGPFWLKPAEKQIATRVIKIPAAGILCEHFDFADKMCTSVLYNRNDEKNVSHSRASFNTMSRHLVLEAEKLVQPQPQKQKYKKAEL